MSKKKTADKLQFEFVPLDKNSIALKPSVELHLPNVILRCFEAEDLEKLNIIGQEISKQYVGKKSGALSKNLIAVKDFLMK